MADEEEERRVIVIEEERKNKSYLPRGNKMSKQTGKATFKVSYVMYARNVNSEHGDRELEKALAIEIGNREIVFIERKPNGEFMIITREWN